MPERPESSLYRRVLGDAVWLALPNEIRRLHDVRADVPAVGRATVERGSTSIARSIAWIVGMPKAGHDVPVQVTFIADARGELWQRTFAGKRFASYQFDGPEPGDGIVFERFGLITIALHLIPEAGRLNVVPIRWSLLGIPLPRTLMPIGETYEFVDAENRFNFHVEIGHPWLGLIVRYRGFLVPT